MRFLFLFALSLAAVAGPAWTEQPNVEHNRDEAAQAAAKFSSNGDPQLSDYLRMALDQNPGISAVFSQYRAAVQRMPQVGTLPDPMLMFTRDLRIPETRSGAQTSSIAVSQQFPWFGTLSAREQVAAKEAAMYREQYEASKNQIVQKVKTAYYNLAFIDAALDINGEERLLLEHYEKLAEARYQQGDGLQQAVVKLQAEITRVQYKLQELKSRRVDAEASLNALSNRPPDTPVLRIKLPPAPAVDIDYTQLFQVGRRNRPEVLGALLQIERDEKRIDLARKDYWPNFTLGGMFMNMAAGPMAPGDPSTGRMGMNVYSVNLGINLPVHRGKYDAEVAEATEAKVRLHARLSGHRQFRRSIRFARSVSASAPFVTRFCCSTPR